ncbi:MAG: hypothetical protein JW709_08460 [Sedimentisphaerales bacterium]|nr:hypothetical protein [Sedimentisphaerales bacterium]
MSLFSMAALASSIQAANEAASRPGVSGVNLLRTQVRLLEANLAKALMINEAFWELVRDKTGLTEQDLYDKLYEVDMRDGKLDGKNQPDVRNCPKCNRPVSGRHSHCLYCGQVIDESIFHLT